MNLYQKYRPASFNEFFGNESVKKILQGYIENNNFPPSILIHGDSGCGKTSLARLLAYSMNCQKHDLIEMNSASYGGVDKIRWITEMGRYRFSDPKFFLFDESHNLNSISQQALLKVIEEPPPLFFFAFCTTELEEMVDTLRNRCFQYKVNPLNRKEMNSYIKYIAKKEAMKLTNDDYEFIINESQGVPREALKILFTAININ